MKKLIVLPVLFLVTVVYSQTILTIGEIFDFDINDEFHTTKVYPPEPPNAIRMKVIGKYFSATGDTVFYIRSFNNYHSVFNPEPTPHFDYIFNIYTDTVFYKNLNDNVLCDVMDTSCVSITDTTLCGVPANGWELLGLEQYWSNVYGKGLGLVRDVYVEDGTPLQSYDYQMFYFRKDTLECGIPDSTITSVASNKFSFGIENIYPNPFSDEFTIRLSDDIHSCNIKIFDLKGVKIYETTVTDRADVVIDQIDQKGFYILKIETGEESYVTKILKK